MLSEEQLNYILKIWTTPTLYEDEIARLLRLNILKSFQILVDEIRRLNKELEKQNANV